MAVSSNARRVIAAALVSSAGLPATADTADGGYYARVFGGVSSLSDTDLSGTLTGSTGFDSGAVFGAALGYDYAASPFRSELEFAYRSGDADGSAGFTGDFASTTFAVNGYYDFAPIAAGRLKPYVGAGLAYITEIDFDVSGGPAAGEYSDDGVFGYQLMAGVDYPVSDRWSLNGELRYFSAGSQTLTGTAGTLTADYDSLDLIIGTTFRF